MDLTAPLSVTYVLYFIKRNTFNPRRSDKSSYAYASPDNSYTYTSPITVIHMQVLITIIHVQGPNNNFTHTK